MFYLNKQIMGIRVIVELCFLCFIYVWVKAQKANSGQIVIETAGSGRFFFAE